MKKHNYILFFFLGIFAQVNAQPNTSSKNVIDGLAVYGDISLPNVFYYAPLYMELVTDVDGQPDFKFVRMTHIGSRARGMEEWKQSSVIQFTIKPNRVQPNSFTEIKNKIKESYCSNCKVKLVPLPIKKMEAALVYVDIDFENQKTLHSNYFDEDSKGGGIWSSKTFTIRPDKYTSQYLWDAFKTNKGSLSVAYGIWGYLKNNDSVTYHFKGPKELEDVLKSFNTKSEDSTQVVNYSLVNAGAFQIDVNTKKWPKLMEEISFEATLSPRYGLVDVYCYDFNNETRPDLVGKIIEFEASGVGNGMVKTEIEFSINKPEIYAHAVKFEYAVKLNKPLKYRVIELFETGDIAEGDWQIKNNWTGIIDISSKGDFEKSIKTN